MIKIVIEGELTDLNSYIKILNSNRFAGNVIKQNETKRVALEALRQGIEPVKEYPVRITYRWYSRNKRRDIDNVSFAKKFINDGLIYAKVLANDSRKYIASFADEFEIDEKRPRVEVEINTCM